MNQREIPVDAPFRVSKMLTGDLLIAIGLYRITSMFRAWYALILLHWAALFILGPGKDPDTSFTFVDHLAVTVVFLAWAASIMGWGRLLAGRLRLSNRGPALELALGTAAAALLAALLGHIGWIGHDFRPLFIGLTDLGVVLCALPAFRNESAWGFRALFSSPAAGLFSAWILSVILLRALKAQVPWGQSDPLFYHLLGPRLWVDQGRIYFNSSVPIIFMASYWDYLHIWALQLLTGEAGRGLIESQIFAQLTHVVFGCGGCALAVGWICRKNFALPVLETLICVSAALCIPDLNWVASLAKNDWGTSFWLLVAFSGLPAFGARAPDARHSRITAMVSGFLTGMAVAAKFTQLPFAIVVCFVNVIQVVRRGVRAKEELSWFFLFFALALMPFLIRNLYFTGAPLFPFYVEKFLSPESLSQFNPLFLSFVNGYTGTLGLAERITGSLWVCARIVRADWVLLLLVFSIPFALYSRRRNLKSEKAGIPLACAMIALPVWFLAGTKTELRHVGAILIVLHSLAPVVFAAAISGLRFRPQMGVIAMIAIGVAIMSFDSGFFSSGEYGDLSLLKSAVDVIHGESAELRIRSGQAGGLSKAWLRLHAGPSASAVVTNDNQFYYLPLLKAAALAQGAEFRDLIEKRASPEAMLTELSDPLGYQFLVEIVKMGEKSTFSLMVDPLLGRFPCAIVYQAPDSRVIDLRLLHAALQAGSCR